MISERIKLISNYIDKGDLLADIGCDHGYLSLLALEKGVEFIQLIDNKIGPLNKAKENISSEKCIFTLASGLNDLDNRINTVAICGMGGELIAEILNDDLNKAKKMKKLILQPNRNEYELRLFLKNNGFKIIDEDIIFENGKYYEIIISIYNNEIVNYDFNELYFGPILMKTKKSIFIDKWNYLLNHYVNLNNNHVTEELKNKINLIKNILK